MSAEFPDFTTRNMMRDELMRTGMWDDHANLDDPEQIKKIVNTLCYLVQILGKRIDYMLAEQQPPADWWFPNGN